MERIISIAKLQEHMMRIVSGLNNDLIFMGIDF
ncbi:MAG: hypothetical protein ACI9WL_000185 [Rubritalea sp.]|jgi:hypothetical protein